MLLDLEVLNGTMSLKFDPLNTTYTVTLNNPLDTELKLSYQVSNQYEVSIKNNEIIHDMNEVVLTVYNDQDSMSYYFYVYKYETTNASFEVADYTQISDTPKEISPYVLPSLSVICFLIILLNFTFLFKKKKKCRF